jgi:hypothetical protein
VMRVSTHGRDIGDACRGYNQPVWKVAR